MLFHLFLFHYFASSEGFFKSFPTLQLTTKRGVQYLGGGAVWWLGVWKGARVDWDHRGAVPLRRSFFLNLNLNNCIYSFAESLFILMMVQIVLLKHDNLTRQNWNLDMTAGARKRSNESLITKVETLLAPFSSVAVAILLLPLAPSWTATSSHSSGEPNYWDIAPLTPQSTQVIIRSNLARPSRWEEWGERLWGESFFARCYNC